MLARHRDFLYKRTHDAHPALAARVQLIPSPVQDKTSPPSASPDPGTSTNSVESLTSSAPVFKTSDTPPTSSTTPTSPTPVTLSSTSSLTSSRTSPSSASASSSVPSTTPTVSTSSSAARSTSVYVTPSVSTQAAPSVSFTPSSTLPPSVSPSATPSPSGGINTAAVVGGIAGALAGIAVLGFLFMWCMRRQRNRDLDDFDAQAFKRQSVALVDDPVEPSRSYNPRPPTMIERHNASPALAAQAGYGGQNVYGGYGGYGQQAPYAPPEMIQPVGSPLPHAYGTPTMDYAGYNDPQQHFAGQPSNMGHAAYDGQQQLARQPSNAAYLGRQPSFAAGYAPPTAPPNSLEPGPQYIDLNRSSVSPYQAAQYADISRQLGAMDTGGQAPHGSLELPDDPLPSPFDDPVEGTPGAPPRQLDHPTNAAMSGPASMPQTQGNAAQPHQRPVTVYEEGDAYGGI